MRRVRLEWMKMNNTIFACVKRFYHLVIYPSAFKAVYLLIVYAGLIEAVTRVQSHPIRHPVSQSPPDLRSITLSKGGTRARALSLPPSRALSLSPSPSLPLSRYIYVCYIRNMI
jgi:hypothetical protein